MKTEIRLEASTQTIWTTHRKLFALFFVCSISILINHISFKARIAQPVSFVLTLMWLQIVWIKQPKEKAQRGTSDFCTPTLGDSSSLQGLCVDRWCLSIRKHTLTKQNLYTYYICIRIMKRDYTEHTEEYMVYLWVRYSLCIIQQCFCLNRNI